VRELYTFSRRLLAAHTTSDIYTAIREHLASITGYRTILFEIVARGGGGATLYTEGPVPEQVKRAAEFLVEGHKGSGKGSVVEDSEGRVWLVRSIPGKGGDFGVLAIDLGLQAGKISDTIRERIESVLADATATLERLDLAHALNDARVRSETEALRDALIGSVSHQLRTPLVSILGAATVISRAPGNSGDPRLASLAEILRDEVDRLNNDVQALLDAALISSKGVQLDREWIEPSDIINAALDRRQRLLSGHRVLLDVPDELPFIYGDPSCLNRQSGRSSTMRRSTRIQARRSPLPRNATATRLCCRSRTRASASLERNGRVFGNGSFVAGDRHRTYLDRVLACGSRKPS